ncbi:MAG: GIY-YIG nuclease family protein [Paraclostridium sordellii]
MIKSLDAFGKRTRFNDDKSYKIETKNSWCKTCNSNAGKEHYYKLKELNNYCVYKFIGYNDEVLYVGKTETLITRLNNHFSSNSHLPKSLYDKTMSIELQFVPSVPIMDMKEIYYINKYKPKYNIKHLDIRSPSFTIAEFENDRWIDYDRYRRSIKNNSLNIAINAAKKISENEVLKNQKVLSIFKRKRGSKFIVYLEIMQNDKKKQINKGSFESEVEATKKVNELRNSYEFIGAFKNKN